MSSFAEYKNSRYYQKAIQNVYDMMSTEKCGAFQQFKSPEQSLEKMNLVLYEYPEPAEDFEADPVNNSFFLIFHEVRRFLSEFRSAPFECFKIIRDYCEYVSVHKPSYRACFKSRQVSTSWMLQSLFKIQLYRKDFPDNDDECEFKIDSYSILDEVVYKLVKKTKWFVYMYKVKPFYNYSHYPQSRIGLYKVSPRTDDDIIKKFHIDMIQNCHYEPNTYFVY